MEYVDVLIVGAGISGIGAAYSWTLKLDLTAEYVCRLLNHMTEHGYQRCVPRQNDPSVRPIPFVDLASGYIERAAAQMPKQDDKPPWRLYQNYARDILLIRRGKIDDGVMELR